MELNTRVKTGITGLDSMLNGGFLRGRNILLSGPAGCGKTTFATQFLYNGVMKFKERGLYVTLEEAREKIHEDMSKFGLNLNSAEKKGFHVIGGPIANLTSSMDKVDAKVSDITNEIKEVIAENNIQRVAIDSVNLFTMLLDKEKAKRRALAALGNMLSSSGCTSILTSETKEGSMSLSRYGIEEFVVDGVIVLYLVRQGSQFVPGIVIRKMRGTDHEKEIKLYRMTNKGIIVYPEETLFTQI
jgi:KaiC/GvpD/RAD55 family RecA-like ATPase